MQCKHVPKKDVIEDGYEICRKCNCKLGKVSDQDKGSIDKDESKFKLWR